MYMLLVDEIISANKTQTSRHKGNRINTANFDHNYSENRWTGLRSQLRVTKTDMIN